VADAEIPAAAAAQSGRAGGIAPPSSTRFSALNHASVRTVCDAVALPSIAMSMFTAIGVAEPGLLVPSEWGQFAKQQVGVQGMDFAIGPSACGKAMAGAANAAPDARLAVEIRNDSNREFAVKRFMFFLRSDECCW
jgi:hypothetical protein